MSIEMYLLRVNNSNNNIPENDRFEMSKYESKEYKKQEKEFIIAKTGFQVLDILSKDAVSSESKLKVLDKKVDAMILNKSLLIAAIGLAASIALMGVGAGIGNTPMLTWGAVGGGMGAVFAAIVVKTAVLDRFYRDDWILQERKKWAVEEFKKHNSSSSLKEWDSSIFNAKDGTNPPDDLINQLEMPPDELINQLVMHPERIQFPDWQPQQVSKNGSNQAESNVVQTVTG